MSRVSVVMPARNMGATIERALRSVLADPQIVAVIVIDDGSTDDTTLRARALGDPRVRILPGPEKGVAAALNAAFDEVETEFVARCDADDSYPPERFGHQIAWLDDHSDFVAISTAYSTVDAKGRPIARLSDDGGARDVTEQLRAGRAISHFCTFLTRTDAIRATGGARSWFQTGSDLDLQFRLADCGRIWHDPTCDGYFYTLHDASITHRQSNARREFFDRATREFAVQRRETGQDDLMCGVPPEPPILVQSEGHSARSARQQIAGQLESAAWKAFRSGDRKRALREMWRSVRLDTLSMRRWRGLAAMLVKQKSSSS